MAVGPTILAPAGYVPEQAIAFKTRDGGATVVDPANPLPTMLALSASAAIALAGSASASGTIGPFAPDLGRPIWLTLSGTWTGNVRLLRSTDGGTTKLPLTFSDGSVKPGWTGAMQAAIAEETVATATYWLAITLSAGSVSYRMEQ